LSVIINIQKFAEILIVSETPYITSPSNIKQKLKDYKALIKFTLSITVVFSSVIAYLLAPEAVFSFKNVALLSLGGLLVTGAANAINQIMEKDTDALMKRTANRPLANGNMSENEAWMFTFIAAIGGTLILAFSFNWYAAGISLFSLFLYAFVYTPLKKVNSIAVLVGALPGALPCLIGWVAGTGTFSTGGWVLFAIQFLWQFPHFWAIAWVAHKDYTSAGFKLLPSREGPTKFTALQAVVYAVIMIPVGFLPYLIQPRMSGMVSTIIILLANIYMVAMCVRLFQKMDVPAARRVMFSSYIYLPIILLALLFDKTIV
jgi:heme o synthase